MAYVSNNNIAVSDVPNLISKVHETLSNLGGKLEPAIATKEPAVAISKSVKPDYIVCLEDGKRLKMLKRYLRVNFNMTPEEYKKKWNLPNDYPMVAPNYSAKRTELAKATGLGRDKSRTVEDKPFIASIVDGRPIGDNYGSLGIPIPTIPGMLYNKESKEPEESKLSSFQNVG